MSFEVPYALIGAVGASSPIRPPPVTPYTAAVDEKTTCFTPACDAASSSERVAQVLLP
jgi:hypothetical protein